MPRKWIPPNTDDWIEDYLAGESIKKLASKLGTNRKTLTRTLRERDIPIRDIATANRLEQAGRTREQRIAYTAAAHVAARGRTHSFDEKVKRAHTREIRQLGTSPAEQLLAIWLDQRSIVTVPQKAIGPYNADLAAGTVAVEIFGGGWHGYGRHRARTAERYRYLLDQGWSVVIVWIDQRSYQLQTLAADYIATFCKLACRDPALAGQYRVIWGDGHEAPSIGSDLDKLAVKPTRS